MVHSMLMVTITRMMTLAILSEAQSVVEKMEAMEKHLAEKVKSEQEKAMVATMDMTERVGGFLHDWPILWIHKL